MRESFLDYLKNNVALCDGAIGTQLYEMGVYLNRCFDEINLSDPDMIKLFEWLATEEAKHRHRFEVEYDEEVLREN